LNNVILKNTPSFKGFCTFLKANPLLVAAVSFAMAACFGLKLFDVSTGIDTNHYMINRYGTSYGYAWHFMIGRWGEVLLQHFLYIIKDFNPYWNFLIGLAIIWTGTISASYVLSLFLDNSGIKKDNRLIPFSLLILTSTVWSEMFAFHVIIVEDSFVLLAMPYIVFYLFYSLLNTRLAMLCAVFLALTFLLGIYQSTVFLILIYTFAVFMLLQLTTNERARVYNLLVPKILCVLILSYLAASGIGYLFIKYFNLTAYDYVGKMNHWKTLGVEKGLASIWNYFLNFSIGHSKISTVHYFLPAACSFIFLVIYLAVKKINKHNRLFFIAAGVCIPLCVFFVPVLGANSPPWRSMWTVPFATAIMLLFPIIYFKKVFSNIVLVIAMICVVYQAQVASGMYYTDHMRYEDDKRLAYELDRLIKPLQNANDSIPVAIVGKHRTSKYFKTNFVEGELIGRSFFGFPGGWTSATGDGLAFMHQIGITYTSANMNQMEQALKELQTNPIPMYPAKDCITKITAQPDKASVDTLTVALEKAKLEEITALAKFSNEQKAALVTAEDAFNAAQTIGLAAQDKARALAAVVLTGDAESDAAAKAAYEAALAEFNTANAIYIKAEADLKAAQGEELIKAQRDQKTARQQLDEINKTTEVIVIHLSDDLYGV
jgi:hypothetical protein